MNLYIGSDFHIDFWDIHRVCAPVFDTLGIDEKEYDAFILCGDIAQWSEKELYANFLHGFAKAKKPVFVVVGNHEFYGSTYPDTVNEIKSYFKDTSNLHILQDDFIDINEYKIRVFGATLWTDFNKADSRALLNAKRVMNDYRATINLTPEALLKEHYRSLTALNEAYYSKPNDYKFIVVTHHAPSLKACEIYHNNTHSVRDYTDYYFASNIDEYLKSNDIYPDIWAHGHVHISDEYKICGGKIKVVVNAFGYRSKLRTEPTGYEVKGVRV